MKLTLEIPDGSEAADLVAAYARENGLAVTATAGLLLQALLEKRQSGLRQPGSVAARVEERKRKEAEARKAEADRRRAEAEAKRQAAEASPAGGGQPAAGVSSGSPASGGPEAPGQAEAGKPAGDAKPGDGQGRDFRSRRTA